MNKTLRVVILGVAIAIIGIFIGANTSTIKFTISAILLILLVETLYD